VLRVILIVYALFFCLPALPYYPQDRGLSFVTQLLHSFNVNTSLTDIIKKQMVMDVIGQIERQYGSSVIISLIITPLYPDPVIIDYNRLQSLRADEILTVALNTFGTNGAEFSTILMIDHHSYYMARAGESLMLFNK
jgi:hypothetical protein